MKFQNDDYALGWLAGIIDGEGSVSYKENKWRSVSISNTDDGIIRRVQEILTRLGISHGTSLSQRPARNHKPCWNVRVTNMAGVARLSVVLELAHQGKMALLKKIPTTYSLDMRKFPKSVLEHLYIVEKKSQDDIARILGSHRQKISRMLRDFGLRLNRSEVMRRSNKTRALSGRYRKHLVSDGTKINGEHPSRMNGGHLAKSL